MEDRLSALEDKLTLLQATLDGLPEALARYLLVMQPQLQPQPSSNESPTGELQRRHQFLHPESAYGSGNDDGAGTNGAILVTGATTGNRSLVPAPSTSSNGSVTAQPPPPSKPKLH